jgi:hypothetical protein
MFRVNSLIRPEHLHLAGDSFTGELFLGKSLKDSLNLFKKHLIRSTLLENDWNQTIGGRETRYTTYISIPAHQGAGN